MIKENFAPFSFVNIEVKDYIDAMLAVYKLNDIDLLLELFVTGYQFSVKRYKVIKEGVNEPDPFKMKYRTQINDVIREIILKKLNKGQITGFLGEWLNIHIAEEDRKYFHEILDQELLNLHEGNFARYCVRPSEFMAWFELWNG